MEKQLFYVLELARTITQVECICFICESGVRSILHHSLIKKNKKTTF